VATLDAIFTSKRAVSEFVSKCVVKDGKGFKDANRGKRDSSKKEIMYKVADSRPEGCSGAGDVLKWMVEKRLLSKAELKAACAEFEVNRSGNISELLERLLGRDGLGQRREVLEAKQKAASAEEEREEDAVCVSPLPQAPVSNVALIERNGEGEGGAFVAPATEEVGEVAVPDSPPPADVDRDAVQDPEPVVKAMDTSRMTEADLVATLDAIFTSKRAVSEFVSKCVVKDGKGFKDANRGKRDSSKKEIMYKVADSRPEGCSGAGDVLKWMVEKRLLSKAELKAACAEFEVNRSGNISELLERLLGRDGLGQRREVLEAKQKAASAEEEREEDAVCVSPLPQAPVSNVAPVLNVAQTNPGLATPSAKPATLTTSATPATPNSSVPAATQSSSATPTSSVPPAPLTVSVSPATPNGQLLLNQDGAGDGSPCSFSWVAPDGTLKIDHLGYMLDALTIVEIESIIKVCKAKDIASFQSVLVGGQKKPKLEKLISCMPSNCSSPADFMRWMESEKMIERRHLVKMAKKVGVSCQGVAQELCKRLIDHCERGKTQGGGGKGKPGISCAFSRPQGHYLASDAEYKAINQIFNAESSSYKLHPPCLGATEGDVREMVSSSRSRNTKVLHFCLHIAEGMVLHDPANDERGSTFSIYHFGKLLETELKGESTIECVVLNCCGGALRALVE